ncbi:MAG: glutathione S-transferase family protein [Sandaracinaceae bacterium]
MYTLYTAPTPNGHKISIALEELAVPYEVVSVELGRLEQKRESYLALNPNGRIPTLVDHECEQGPDFAVFESGAILVHLAEKHGALFGDGPAAHSRVMQWLMFQVGGVGPMMGQANVFARYAEERIPFAIERYQRESRRLFEVLERQLDGRDYLVDRYSIADIANYAWVRTHRWSGVNVEGLPNLAAWRHRIRSRPAVERGLAVPVPRPKLRQDEEAEFLDNARKMLA